MTAQAPATAPADRLALWTELIAARGVASMAEVGVWAGAFAQHVLGACPGVVEYLMIDPWRNLADWNKPANVDDTRFEAIYREALARTEPFAARRRVLRGRTADVAGDVADASLDLVYVDGDHTLHGVAIDLIAMWPKVRDGGALGGDDFCPSIWQHPANFEPTLVFPFAVHFAEAVGCRITALGANQFLIEKTFTGFEFVDPARVYPTPELREQLLANAPARGARS